MVTMMNDQIDLQLKGKTGSGAVGLKKTNPSIIELKSMSKEGEEIKHISIMFESMSDVADFQEENQEELQYGNARVDEEVWEFDVSGKS